MTTRIKLRRDTSANWEIANPVLALGEPGYDLTENKLKIGDGVTAWQTLEYGITGDLEIQGTAIKSKDGVTLTSNTGWTKEWVTTLAFRKEYDPMATYAGSVHYTKIGRAHV